jgi:hypothetical protein
MVKICVRLYSCQILCQILNNFFLRFTLKASPPSPSAKFLQISMWVLILLKYTFQLHIAQLTQLADHQKVRIV